MTAESLSRYAKTIITGFIIAKIEWRFTCQFIFTTTLHYNVAPNANQTEIIGLV